MSKSSRAIAILLNATDIRCACGNKLQILDIIWSKGPYFLLLTKEVEDIRYVTYNSTSHKMIHNSSAYGESKLLEGTIHFLNTSLPDEYKIVLKEPYTFNKYNI